MDLKIAHRGLVLVAVPLIFELAFVAVLSYLLFQADQEIKREMHSKAVIACVTSLQSHIMDAATAAGAYNITKFEFFKQRYWKMRQMTNDSLDELDALVVDDPVQKENAERARVVANHGLELIHQLKSGQGEPYTLGALLGSQKSFGVAASFNNQMGVALYKIVETEKPRETLTAAEHSLGRKMVEVALIVGLVLNVIVAILLAVFFTKGITERLQIVTGNTKALTDGKPLKPAIRGEDEIAQLDHYFHAMADHLQEVERMKMELMATVSHDIKTPLTCVDVVLTLLSEGALGELPKQAKDRIDTAEEELSRLIKLTNSLLDVQRLASGKIEVNRKHMPLREILTAATRAMEVFAEQHKVKIECAEVDYEVYADKDLIVDVLVNLLSNAIKYSPPDSVVTVNSLQSAKFVEVRVTDRGRGIPEEFQKKIFERFQQVQESDAKEKGGKGLGLAICRTIIEKHGGEIGVNSREGRGSAFWFCLPRN